MYTDATCYEFDSVASRGERDEGIAGRAGNDNEATRCPIGGGLFVHGGVVVSTLDFFFPDLPKHTLKNFESLRGLGEGNLYLGTIV